MLENGVGDCYVGLLVLSTNWGLGLGPGLSVLVSALKADGIHYGMVVICFDCWRESLLLLVLTCLTTRMLTADRVDTLTQ